jgi:hypothetical protein
MTKTMQTHILAALLLGAASFSPSLSWAGSCCGGGGGATLLLPKFYQGMVDVSFDMEKYDGFWNQDNKYTPDPAGSDLRQYRVNVGYARRLAPRWQTSVLVPFVWNVNKYSSNTSRKHGIGDTTLSLWYEALDDTSAWKIRELKDLTPSITIGPSLLIPTGISPYDGVRSDDVTGRGFYRLDGNMLISKTLHPWSASVSLSYGSYLERPVNREVDYVPPYRKRLGDRSSAAVSLSYIYYVGSGGDAMTGTASLSQLREEDATIDGNRIANSGFWKDSIGGTIAYSSTDHDWGLRATWSHTVKQDGWGKNFPATDIYTIGVNYGFR